MNPLLPVPLVGASVTTWLLASHAAAPGTTEFAMSGLMLLTSLLALAIIEHLFMVIPIPVARLWGRPAEPEFGGGKPHPINPT
jgi:putative photosynthetic complex assembly protein 2